MGKTKTKKVASPQIVEREHGRYLIKAGLLQNSVVARAFPKPPSKFRHIVAEDTGKNIEDAIARLIHKLEALRSERRTLRRVDPALASGVPTSEEYADALRSLSPGPKVLNILHDQALLRGHGMMLSELAKAGEFAAPQDLLNVYEKLGLEIYKLIEPDEALQAGLPVVVQTPDDGEVDARDAAILQPELQDAVLQLLGTDRRER